ncbi:MAG: M28 family peptidase [Pirellulaceae bacterium]
MALLVFGIIVLLVAVGLFAAWERMIHMPGESFHGELPPLENPQVELRASLEADVEHLATAIGERNLAHYPQLLEAADYLEGRLREFGYKVQRQTFKVNGTDCDNLEVEIKGQKSPDEIVIVGAHYDTAPGTPGANDNASGMAALLAIAERMRDARPACTLRFVAFTNEEPPYFQTPDMGSWVYARRCRQRGENIVAALSLETIGYYRDEPGSQVYPPPLSAFYPSEGDFIAVVGNVGSRPLVHRVVDVFRRHAKFPSEGGAVPGDISGVGWSDHWSFWQEGYQGVMITDTAPFRYPYYHRPQDTPDKLEFDRMTRVVEGLIPVVADLAGVESLTTRDGNR